LGKPDFSKGIGSKPVPFIRLLPFLQGASMPNQKLLLRAALDIHSQLQRLEGQSANVDLPQDDWNCGQSLLHRMRQAESRGWYGAARVLRKELDWPLKQCAERLQTLGQSISAQDRPSDIANLHDIFNDLVALFDEFAAVEIDLASRKLSVTTEPIVLEGFELGPFNMNLSWARIGQFHSYDVVALEPNPPRSSEDTPHPHVRDKTLCEGDGQVPIRKTLRAGRLHDFFQIVNRILNTYNGGSAYVPLAEWDGQACDECGEVVDSDHSTECYRCGAPLCRACSTECALCNESHCNECTLYCHNCRTVVCTDCTARCAGCSLIFCNECLKESGLCEACEEKQHVSTIDRDEATPVQTQAPAPTAAGEAVARTAPATVAV
jgi:hypothetical protein